LANTYPTCRQGLTTCFAAEFAESFGAVVSGEKIGASLHCAYDNGCGCSDMAVVAFVQNDQSFTCFISIY